ncbi:protein of unknown function [Taphrina deformans PYCC 5710]|uniref:Serine/threonine-protein kinase n=1 Tax=Taphrina deformans (strain PYCC 5710 / ATCC 11124 / CBS 356.35 / IMI 108563 / JCM 9778 / NBRC 8474) TaxID=1097556 RepID=R4XKH1_TAPDE|nr:protein of unknown function [Taphrina deformans PYCC 5710]|eukprot:CCG83819.1 protein of unknown function [Taphrina deformans PYCC 5710]
MPALATIQPPNVRASTTEAKPHAVEAKKKPKASSLCYTPPAMINDKKRDRSYFRRGLLGEGGFARCFEVTDFQGTRLAAKCVAKKSITSEKIKMKLLGEIKVHKSMDHPNIVRQLDCFEDDVNVYMILDICTNGTLAEMLRKRTRFTEPEVRYFGLQILGATKYMHSRRVIHRDLKLGNLFLDDNMCIKVGDFGLAALLVDDNDRKKTLCGTPNYIAPEVLFASPEGHSYEVDLWCIGIIFYAMIVGKPPFQSKDVKAIYAKIKVNEYEFPAEANVSANARSLITSLLSTDPENRPSLDDLAGHPFFNTGIMPRSIPSSAKSQEPQWPEGQATSIFKRNHSFVSINAGIGQDQSAGREPGQKVDAVLERPEGDRYLPVSLSPRTGPAAKMVNLKSERAGGRVDTLSERLKSVQLEGTVQQGYRTTAQKQLGELQARDLRRTTLGAGAVRTQSYQKNPASTVHSKDIDSPANRLQIPAEEVAVLPIEENRLASKLRGPSRVVSEPTRPITRSSRFAQIPGTTTEAAQTSTGLSKPVRRTVSSIVPSVRPNALAGKGDGNVPSTRSSSYSSRDGCAAKEDEGALIGMSRPVSRVASRMTSRTESHINRDEKAALVPPPKSTTNRPSSQPWSAITRLATWLHSAIENRPSNTSSNFYAVSTLQVSHISKWVDYSHRYGLGYQLSDESTGVYFNDATSIVLRKLSANFQYIPSPGVQYSEHAVDSPPKELEKKVYLLKHFKGYMTTHLNSATTEAPEKFEQEQPLCRDVLYMTHYLRTKAGILFRLSDGTLQVNFTDHSKLMVPMPDSSDNCRVRYVDTAKVTNIWSLQRAVQNPECMEKIECLATILSNFAKYEGQNQDL